MKTLEEVLELMDSRIERAHVEDYIAREWVRPEREHDTWHFEAIDIARLRLVHHLVRDIDINTEGMDVVLSLIDQLYAMRAHMKRITHAISAQPSEIQAEIRAILQRQAAIEADPQA